MVHCARCERLSDTFAGDGGGSVEILVLSTHSGFMGSDRLESVFGVELPVLRVGLCARIVCRASSSDELSVHVSSRRDGVNGRFPVLLHTRQPARNLVTASRGRKA